MYAENVTFNSERERERERKCACMCVNEREGERLKKIDGCRERKNLWYGKNTHPSDPY